VLDSGRRPHGMKIWRYPQYRKYISTCTATGSTCLLFSYLIKVVALFYFICCYQHVLVNKDIRNDNTSQH